MRFFSAALSALVMTSSVALAQTGYTLKTYPAGGATTLKVADFNHDGHPDLLGYNPNLTSVVYLNDGNGGFKAPVPLPTTNTGYVLSAIPVDLKGNGYPDVVACTNQSSRSFNQDYLVVFVNDGTGNFTVGQTTPIAGCVNLVPGDVNLDGHQDVVISNSIANTSTNPYTYNNQLTTYFGDGTGNLVNPVTVSNINLDIPGAQGGGDVNCSINDVIGGNFYVDNQFSLIVNSQCNPGFSTPQEYGTTFLAHGDGTGDFTFQQSYAPLGYLSNGQTTDLNKDGRPDGIFTNTISMGNTHLYDAINNGSGNFTYNQIGSSPGFVGVTSADLNGDGIPDLAASSTPTRDRNTQTPAPGAISTFLGSSNGTFTASQSWTIGTSSTVIGNIVAADVNGDGAIDLVTVVNDQAAGSSLLYVYTKQTSSSPGCTAPSTVNTNRICTPANGATVSSPVTLSAASNVSGFTLNRVYVDNQSVYQTASQSVSTALTIAAGSHRLVLVSYNNQGQSFTSTSTFTVSGSGTPNACLPAGPGGAIICSPAPGSSPNSPITFTAGAIARTGNITALRGYIDNVAVFTVNNPSASTSQQVTQSVNVAPGTHSLVIVGYQSTGGTVSASESITVVDPAKCYPSAAGAQICTPGGGSTIPSPFTINAGATAGSGYITAIRVYLDNVAQTLVSNPQQSRSFAISTSQTAAAGGHNIVVVGYQSTGGSVSARAHVTVQ